MPKKPIFERIQDAIFTIEEGVGAILVKVGVYVLLLAGLVVLYTATQFHGLDEDDALEAAQVGRNLAQEGQFRTSVIRPMDLWFLKRNFELDDRALQDSDFLDSMPMLSMAPAHPAVLAATFRAWPTSFQPSGINHPAELRVLGVGILFTLLCAVPIYLLGRRLFSHRTGFLAMGIFFLSNTVWQNALSGLETPMLSFLGALGCLAAMSWVQRSEADATPFGQMAPWGLLVLACAGLLLTRYAAWILLPGLLIALGLAMPRQGWLKGGVTLLLAACALTPWILRNQTVSGSWFGTAPWFALNETDSFPDREFESRHEITVKPKLVERELRAKVVHQLEEALPRGMGLVGGSFLASALFFASLFFRFSDPKAASLRWGIVISLGLWALVAGVTGDRGFRLIALFFPAAAVYAAAFFLLLQQRMNFQLRVVNMLITGAFLAAVALPLLFTLLPPNPRRTMWNQVPSVVNESMSLFRSDEWVVSDVPMRTAWYGNQTSLLLPRTLDEFEAINDHIRFCHGIYFTEQTRDLPWHSQLISRDGSHWTWSNMVFGGDMRADFPLPILASEPGHPHILYMDRERFPIDP